MLSFLPNHKKLLLDGGTATSLYAAGMPRDCLMEEWVLEHPQTLQKIQADFISAGSDLIYAPTFSANRARLARYHLEDKTEELNQQLVSLSRETAKSKLVAGCLSPTMCKLAPYGDVSFDELVDIYAQQANAQNQAGVDLFVIETMISLTEARAAVLACRRYDKPVFVTITLNQKGEIFSGADPLVCLKVLEGLSISAFGLNCSNGPDAVCRMIAALSEHTSLSLIAKPNAGGINPILPHQYEIGAEKFAEAVNRILDAGASVVGGCCGTTAEYIRLLRDLLDQYNEPLRSPPEIQQDTSILLANDREIFLLQPERLEISSIIHPEIDMSDTLLTVEQGSSNLLHILVETPEEASDFSKNQSFARLPVCFLSNSEEALERAVFLYNGRCMIDKQSAIPEITLQKIASKYGALLY